MISITIQPHTAQDPRSKMAMPKGEDDEGPSGPDEDDKEMRGKISKKIKFLMKNEGMDQKQAAGKAYGMWRDGSL